VKQAKSPEPAEGKFLLDFMLLRAMLVQISTHLSGVEKHTRALDWVRPVRKAQA
jgi:hypothetical protein